MRETCPMPKEATITVTLEPELRADFMAEAAGEDRSASQIMRNSCVAMSRAPTGPRVQAYLQRKVEAAHLRTGRRVRTNGEVEADFADRLRRIVADRA
jgi:hypothetical protein